MTLLQNELSPILWKHTLWVHGEPGGEKADLWRADLRGADLREANLRGANLREANLWRTYLWGADLRGANLRGADLREADLRKANLWGTNLREADMREANLWGADLRGADLREADLDYSCWPLWCGSLYVKVDVRIAAQLAYHFCRLDCDDPAFIQARNALVPLANTFHRAEECGRLKEKQAGT